MLEPRTLADELGVPDFHEAVKDLRKRYVDARDEIDRRNHAALIDAQLEHKAGYAVEAYLRAALQDPLNQAEHLALSRWCEHNALLRRIVGEVATVYDEPATRTVASGSERFDALAKDLALDLVMRHATQKLVAHGALWISMRVREERPVLDVITPARFWCVTPELDPTHLLGVLVEIPRGFNPAPRALGYKLFTRWQTIEFTHKFELIGATENPLAPNLPGVLVTMEPPAVTGRFLPERCNADIVAAETAGAFQALIALREAMTVQKQAYVSGDTSATVMGQSASSQREVFLPEGVNVLAVDRSIDVAQYLRHAESIADTTASNHGIAPATRKLESASSGYELWLRAQPLVRRRRLLIDILRDAEQRLAEHMAAVVEANALDAYSFNPSGFAIQFGELSMPQSEGEALANFETRRRLGLDDTISEIARRSRIAEDEAAEDLATHVRRETARIGLMQELSRMGANSSTAVGDSTNFNRDTGPSSTGEKEISP